MSPLDEPRYNVEQVARLVEIRRARARRWLMGYQGPDRRMAPLLADPKAEASFLDVMELVYASAFLRAGFSPYKVRQALEEARGLTGLAHPFANRCVYIAPNDIFLQQAGQELRSLLQAGQEGIHPVITDISKRLDFDQAGNAVAWHPRGRAAPIMVDPFHVDGAARIPGTRITTAAVMSLWRAEGHAVDTVAQAFGQPPDLIRAVLDYETTTANAA
jgi:uncharacterized protein (DUF433 family)